MRKISAIILAGGRSSRMGKNKAFLVIDQISMIERQIQELTRRFAPIIIVSGQPELYDALGVEVYQDEFPGYGPLAGIQAGLKAAPTEEIFVIPCDMPFVDADLGTQMLRNLGEADGIALQTPGGIEPLCAIYTKRCLPAIETFLRTGGRKVVDFYPHVNMKYLPAQNLSLREPLQELLYNVNTPQDYAQARVMREGKQRE